MQRRVLGSTGLSVSVVGLGTWQFGDEWGQAYEQADADAIFDTAREVGINLIDTAECYGDHKSERFVGAAIERDRDDWVVATKFGHHFIRPFERTEPRRPEDLVKQLEDSLVALRTDRVDLWQYHSWADDQFFDDDVLATIYRCKDQGKVLHVGNSIALNTNLKQIETLQDRGIEAVQIIYNRLDRGPEAEVFPSCQKHNLGVLARVPLASGFLSGKYKPGHVFGPDEVRGRWGDRDVDGLLGQAQEIRRREVPAGVDMASWALAWVLQNPAVTAVIPGCKNPAQVRSNAAAAQVKVSAGEA